MDTKAAFDREAFEKWFNSEVFSLKLADEKLVNCYWDSWVASRAAIEIELKQFDEFQMVHYGTTEDYAKGYVDAQNNANKAITSHGIRIKGKTE